MISSCADNYIVIACFSSTPQVDLSEHLLQRTLETLETKVCVCTVCTAVNVNKCVNFMRKGVLPFSGEYCKPLNSDL